MKRYPYRTEELTGHQEEIVVDTDRARDDAPEADPREDVGVVALDQREGNGNSATRRIQLEAQDKPG